MIVVLKKLGKPNYLDLGAYRLITLLNILSKILESIVTRYLSELIEAKKLLLSI